MIPTFELRVVASMETHRTRFGVALLSPHGNLVLELGYEPFSLATATPCCAAWAPVNPRRVYARCDSCVPNSYPRGAAYGNDGRELLEAYGFATGWWTDVLRGCMDAADLWEQISTVGREANGRYSIHTTNAKTRAETIQAGLHLNAKALGWDVMGGVGHYFSPREDLDFVVLGLAWV